MTPTDLFPLIREDAGRDPLPGELVATDADVADSPTGTFSDAEMLPLVIAAADEIAQKVDPRHVPDRIREFTGDFSGGAPLDPGVLRLLPTRVYAASGSEIDARGGTGPLLVRSDSAIRRRGLGAGVFSWDGAELLTPKETVVHYFAVARMEAQGAGDDIGLPAYLEHAVVLHVLAALYVARRKGAAVTAENAYRREIAAFGAAVVPQEGTAVAV